jgi:hypothetical protein
MVVEDLHRAEVLYHASVLGREFDFDLLYALWDRGAEATLEALDDLLRHRLVDEDSGAVGAIMPSPTTRSRRWVMPSCHAIAGSTPTPGPGRRWHLYDTAERETFRT